MYRVSRKNCEKIARVRGSQRAQSEDAHRQQGSLRPDLDDHERDKQRGGPEQQANGGDRGPAVLGSPGQRVHEQHQPAGHRRRARDIEVPVLEFCPALLEQDRAQDEDERAGRHVDEEDPGPAERAGEGTSEQDACGAAATGGGSPDAERDVALTAFAEGRGEDRQRGRREQRGAESLQGSEQDQRPGRPGQAVKQRHHCEQRQAGHEESASAEQVGESPTQQQHAAEEDRVGGDHPLQALLGEVEIGLDRR
jgi:hypothetical protein